MGSGIKKMIGAALTGLTLALFFLGDNVDGSLREAEGHGPSFVSANVKGKQRTLWNDYFSNEYNRDQQSYENTRSSATDFSGFGGNSGAFSGFGGNAAISNSASYEHPWLQRSSPGRTDQRTYVEQSRKKPYEDTRGQRTSGGSTAQNNQAISWAQSRTTNYGNHNTRQNPYGAVRGQNTNGQRGQNDPRVQNPWSHDNSYTVNHQEPNIALAKTTFDSDGNPLITTIMGPWDTRKLTLFQNWF